MSTELGYARLAQAISAPGALLFNLRKLDIHPFLTSKVEVYKEGKERTGMYSQNKIGIMWLCLMTLFAAATVYGEALRFKDNWLPPHYVFNVVMLIGAIACFIVCVNVKWGHGDRRVTRWTNYSLWGYHGNVPEFVLMKALAIKRLVPDAVFSVVALEEKFETKAIRRTVDPFLQVSLKDERYYVDVWDEEEFEALLP